MDDPFRETDDVTLIMEVLLDVRGMLEYTILLLEEDDGEETEENA